MYDIFLLLFIVVEYNDTHLSGCLEASWWSWDEP